jgi:GNAT superfamily N-acetyltransferase
MIQIEQVSTAEQLDAVRALMRAFVDWHRRRHAEDITLINRYFDADKFENELADLPGHYGLPSGRLLLARKGDRSAGCAALRDLGDGACEMKRMFIPAGMRGQGIGRALVDRLLLEADTAGYRRMRLDTSVRQTEAINLYEGAGFRRIAPYYPLPDDLRNWLVFMERVF